VGELGGDGEGAERLTTQQPGQRDGDVVKQRDQPPVAGKRPSDWSHQLTTRREDVVAPPDSHAVSASGYGAARPERRAARRPALVRATGDVTHSSLGDATHLLFPQSGDAERRKAGRAGSLRRLRRACDSNIHRPQKQSDPPRREPRAGDRRATGRRIRRGRPLDLAP